MKMISIFRLFHRIRDTLNYHSFTEFMMWNVTWLNALAIESNCIRCKFCTSRYLYENNYNHRLQSVSLQLTPNKLRFWEVPGSCTLINNSRRMLRENLPHHHNTITYIFSLFITLASQRTLQDPKIINNLIKLLKKLFVSCDYTKYTSTAGVSM